MSLEEIIQEIDKRGKEQMQELSEHYEARFAEIRQKYSNLDKDLRDEWKSKIESETVSLKKNIISSAQMESLRMIRGREKEIVNSALEKVEDHLQDIKKWKNYKELLSSLADISFRALGKDCMIKVGEKDQNVLPEAEFVRDDPLLSKYGGIVASSKDGSMELDLRIYTIYLDLREKMIAAISENIGE